MKKVTCIYCRTTENQNGLSVCDACNKKIEEKRKSDFDKSELGQLFDAELMEIDRHIANAEGR